MEHTPPKISGQLSQHLNLKSFWKHTCTDRSLDNVYSEVLVLLLHSLFLSLYFLNYLFYCSCIPWYYYISFWLFRYNLQDVVVIIGNTL